MERRTEEGTRVRLAVQGYLARARMSDARVVPLTGDASDRKYFRVLPKDDDPFVLAVHADAFDVAKLPFLNVAELFTTMGVPIPKVIGHEADLGVLALQDLGDTTLQANLGRTTKAEHEALYRDAVEIIETIQRRGAEVADPRFLPYGVAFDHEKLTWELDFFVRHFLEAYRGASLDADTRGALATEFDAIVQELAAEPRVLCHRDYHSRNLMLYEDALYVIDFQDTRMGPETYDLVSLLRDSYVDLPEEVVRELIAYYLALRGRKKQEQPEFRRRFDLMALQRNLKALGTFGFQTATRGNPVYIQYIPRTLSYVQANLERYPRFARLRALLAEHLEEFG